MEKWKECVQSLGKSFVGKLWALVVLPKLYVAVNNEHLTSSCIWILSSCSEIHKYVLVSTVEILVVFYWMLSDSIPVGIFFFQNSFLVYSTYLISQFLNLKNFFYCNMWAENSRNLRKAWKRGINKFFLQKVKMLFKELWEFSSLFFNIMTCKFGLGFPFGLLSIIFSRIRFWAPCLTPSMEGQALLLGCAALEKFGNAEGALLPLLNGTIFVWLFF